MDMTAWLLSILWCGFAVMVAVAARNRHRSGTLYFICALLLSPIIAAILLGVSGGLRRTT